MDKTLADAYFSDSIALAKEDELRQEGYAIYLDSIFLQRLKRVSFLGVLDSVYELPRPSNRYVHTICVSHLALRLARRVRLPAEMERAFVIAHILHDIGHAPFSHNSEPFLLERLNLYHQGLLSAFFVQSNRFAPNGTSLAHLVASETNTVAEAVSNLILQSRRAAKPLQELFYSPLNCDKLEGNHRTLVHLGRDSICPDRIVELFRVHRDDVFIESSELDVVEEFWEKEKDVYWNDIYTTAVFAAEAMLTRALKLCFQESREAEAFLVMTDDEAYAALESSEQTRQLLHRIAKNQLYRSLRESHEAVFAAFEGDLREHRFDSAIREEIENQIATALGLRRGYVISHFSRRKYFGSQFSELRQRKLFDTVPELTPAETVASAFRNSKRSGDFCDVFWSSE